MNEPENLADIYRAHVDERRPETTREAIQALAAERVEPVRGTDGWNSGSSGTDAGTEHQWYAGDGAVPAPRTGGTMPEHVPAPDHSLVHLGGTVRVERVLAQPDVPEIRHALMAYGPAGLYRYDVGLTSAVPWGDADVFHVIKVWFQETEDSTLFHASSRIAGRPWNAAEVAGTVQGILNTLERIKAIQENRDAYQVRTTGQGQDEPPEIYGSPPKRVRPIKDNPQA